MNLTFCTLGLSCFALNSPMSSSTFWYSSYFNFFSFCLFCFSSFVTKTLMTDIVHYCHVPFHRFLGTSVICCALH